MKKAIELFLLLIVFTSCVDKTNTIFSSDGKLSFHIETTEEGELIYSISADTVRIIEPSVIKFTVDSIHYGTKVSQIKLIEKTTVTESYSYLGNFSQSEGTYTKALFSIRNQSHDFQIEVMLGNTSVSFRYVVDNDDEIEYGEDTEFRIPDDVRVWKQEDIRYYEGLYNETTSNNIEVGKLVGPPVVFHYPSGIYSSITEASLIDFAGMALKVSKPSTFTTFLDGRTFKKGTIRTPWRVILIGSLNEIVNNTAISDLSEPQKEELFTNDSSWLIPGKSVWSWMTGTGVSFNNMKEFSRLAGQIGFKYNLVDEGWTDWEQDGKDCWTLMRELSDYSDQFDVKVWIWKAYPDRKGIDGIQTYERRDAFFRKCKEAGVVGIKIDFFDEETQTITRYYKEALEHAAKYQLMVNFHGCNKPTGVNRTYPNEMTREGIRGYEYGVNVDCNVTLPLTRLIAGHGDSTPLYLNVNQMNGTTTAHQLASAVAYSSPLLCVGAHPLDILNSQHCEFIKNIPVVWDKSVVLPNSRIGDFVLIARQSADVWYLAGMTNKKRENEEIAFSFLGDGDYNLELIQDCSSNKQNTTLINKVINQTSKVNVVVEDKGGFVARISRRNTND